MTTTHTRREREGFLLCVLAAAGFGGMAVFAKLAYRHGASVLEVLSIRFLIATAVLAALGARGAGRPPTRRAVLVGLALGGVLYAAESGLFFASLTRMGASVAELLLYAYPAMVVVGAIALRRERATRRRLAALVLASGGVALVMAGGRGGDIDPLGAALALGAAVGYTAYILLADSAGRALDAHRLSTLVCAGAAVTFTVAALAAGKLTTADPAALGWIAAIAVVSTVVPITAFLAGLERIGPGRASIVSTLEPPVTVLLAFAVFGERLGPLQFIGGAVVLAAVVVLQAPRRGRRLASRRAAAPVAARPAAASPVGEVAPQRAGVGV